MKAKTDWKLEEEKEDSHRSGRKKMADTNQGEEERD